MQYSDPLNSLAHAMFDAPPRMIKHEDGKAVRRNECEFILFQQGWSDCSLGHGGIAGQSISSGDVVVVLGPYGDAAVYSSRLLYYLDRRLSEAFWSDLARRRMAPKGKSAKYHEPVPA